MNDPILKLKLLAKTEMTLGKLHARQAASRFVFATIALFFVLLGLGMLNFAGYQALSVRFSPAVAALFIAVIDIVIGMAVLRIAASSGSDSDEEKMAQEIRDMVYSELNNDIEAVKREFTKVTDDVYRIRSGFNSLTSGKLGGAVGLIPLLDLLTKTVKKKRSTRMNQN
ncbi:MAG: phage holin family protein [Thermodesulfobacteriota bacterium]